MPIRWSALKVSQSLDEMADLLHKAEPMGEFQEWKPIFKRIGKLPRGVISSYFSGYVKELEKKSKGAGKTYTCKQCGATFNSAPALANHIRWQHPKPKQES